MTQPQPQHVNFPALKYSLHRRNYDYHHGVFRPVSDAHVASTRKCRFYDLEEKVHTVEMKLSCAPPALCTQITADLQRLTADVLSFGKKVDLNPFRICRRAPNAESQDVLEALRTEKFGEWNGILDGMLEKMNYHRERVEDERRERTRELARQTRGVHVKSKL